MHNRQKILDKPNFIEQVEEAYSSRQYEKSTNVDQSLYDGFLDQADRKLANRISQSSPVELSVASYSFKNPMLSELLFRYRARNWPSSLTTNETGQWHEHCMDLYNNGPFGIPEYTEQIMALREGLNTDSRHSEILEALTKWGEKIAGRVEN